jgi:peroxiredoxin Q/BCP
MHSMVAFGHAVLLLAQLFSGMGEVAVGDKAPNFSLPWATADTICFEPRPIGDMLGRSRIILAFYPADWSGGCTKEICSFRDDFTELNALGAEIYGISGDYLFSHHEWAKQHRIQFTLLSDHSHAVARRYGSFDEASGYNRRTVFVLDTLGIVRYVDLKYTPGTTESLQRLKDALRSLR